MNITSDPYSKMGKRIFFLGVTKPAPKIMSDAIKVSARTFQIQKEKNLYTAMPWNIFLLRQMANMKK